MATTISTIFNKTLFQRLLDSKKLNTEIIYFDKTTTTNGENINKVFDIDDTIFYKPFEIEINYDISKYSSNQKPTFAFFCCRKTNSDSVPSVHIFCVNKILNMDITSKGNADRIVTNLTIGDKGKINIKYNEGIIKLYYNDVLKGTYDKSNNKLTNRLSKKCSVGQSYSADNGTMANGINGTVNVKIKELII